MLIILGTASLKYTDDPWLSLVEDDIVNLVVSVHETAAVFRLRALIAKKGHHFIVVRDLAHRLLGLDVDGL